MTENANGQVIQEVEEIYCANGKDSCSLSITSYDHFFYDKYLYCPVTPKKDTINSSYRINGAENVLSKFSIK